MPTPRLLSRAARLRALLSGPRAVRLAVAVAALLSVPVLYMGLHGDDHILYGILQDRPPWRGIASPLDLFRFYDGNPERTRIIVDHGFSPWWTDMTLRIAFLRPLTAATHWLDTRLWPDTPGAAHAVSLGFYLGLVAAAGALYRRVLGAGTGSLSAGLAAVMFAMDPSHGTPVAWISNRNALVAGLFGVLSVLLHDRARREGRALLGVASATCLGLGLLGGEVAVGAVAYLFAYAVCLDRATVRARLASLAPPLVVLTTWAIAYRVLGYGARSSGLYIDPAQAPLRFVREAATNLPLLLQTELGGLGPDGLIFAPRLLPLFLAAAAVLLSLSLAAFAPLMRERRARFLAVGALLSTVPAVATFPAGRLMLLPSFGLLGLVALVVEGVVDGAAAWRPGPSRWAAVAVAAWVGGGHVVLAPPTFDATLFQLAVLEHLVGRYGDGIGGDAGLEGQRLVVVNAPDAFFTYYVIGQREGAGRPAPASLLVMAPGTRAVEIERRDARTVVVRSGEGFYRRGTELLTRDPATTMAAGTRVELSGVTIEVTRAGADGVPTEAAFHFDAPLEDARLRWVAWRGRALAPYALPPVGGKERFEAQEPSM
jgi:hypothetical protein